MTVDQAYRLLGISVNSNRSIVEQAYKSKLKKLQRYMVAGQPLAVREQAQREITELVSPWELLKNRPWQNQNPVPTGSQSQPPRQPAAAFAHPQTGASRWSGSASAPPLPNRAITISFLLAGVNLCNRASSIKRRMEVLREAHERGLRTYGMLCPILPGVADSFDQIEELIHFAIECNVEEIFIEPVNPRGRGLKLTQEALANSGYSDEATAIETIRKRNAWSRYVARMVSNVQKSIHKQYDINRLRFLLYPSRLLEEHVTQIKKDDAGVVWLQRSSIT
jgi:hypothetical protein